MKTWSLDSETALIARAQLDPPLACITACDETMEAILHHHTTSEPFLRYLFEECEIVGANFSYDAAVFMKAFPLLTPIIFKAYRESRIIDCQLSQRLIDNAFGSLNGYTNAAGVRIEQRYSLAALYERHGFGSLDKSGDTYRLRYGELIDLPLSQWPQAAIDYAKDDAVATLKVHNAQLSYSEFTVDGPAQARRALALQLISVRGMVTDGATCLKFIEETKIEIEKAKLLCEREGLLRGPDTKPKSKIGTRDTAKAKDLMRRVCSELEVEPMLTEGGDISLSAEACRDSGDEVLRAYSMFVSQKTALGRAEQLLEGSKGLPLQTSFVPFLANGRVSSREPGPPLVGGGNTQNLDATSKIRNCYVPRKGYRFCSIDYTGAELVSFAQCELWMTGKSLLADALNNDVRIHSETSAMILKCTPDEAYSRRKDGGLGERTYKLAKITLFGLLGGMGWKALMININKKAKSKKDRVDQYEARELHRACFDRWGMRGYFDAVKAQFPDGEGGGLATCKQFVTGQVRGHMSYTECANNFFSSLSASAIGAGLYRVTEACYTAKPGDALFDCYVVNFLHDEQFLELNIEHEHEAAFAATEIMLTAYREFCPDVKITAEPALQRFWSKNASFKLNENGRLIPCEEAA